MMLNKQDIINLPVYTRSGQHLGRVVDFEISSQTHQVEKYMVRSGLIIGGILQKNLLVSPAQVVSLSAKKMIVEDTFTPEAELKKATSAA